MSLLSYWDEMDVPIELIADDLWAAEDDKTVFLSVGVDFSIHYICNNDQFPLPWYQWVLKTNQWEMRKIEKTQQIEIWEFCDEWSKYYVWLYPPILKIKKCQSIHFDECTK